MKAAHLVFVGILLLGTAASAGERKNVEVKTFCPVSTLCIASGSMAGAYNSSDSTQFIECAFQVNASSSGVSYYLRCDAKDSTGATGWCEVSNASQAYIDVIQKLADTDVIQFSYNPADHKCVGLVVRKGSAQNPRGM
ncbi:hypothetical protein [Archangium sp. Cb G35]|uniref:hypothetical protein n=1 Tax=Archangium sp. Cb G35 TaxID=1920190 RepID=UPI001160E75E|nr:hypothetical protein [Archangium sp. Cb G35]